MTTVTTTQPIPARVLLPIPPTATQVLLLQAIHGYPAVSLLMNTAPRSCDDDTGRCHPATSRPAGHPTVEERDPSRDA